MNTDQLIMEKIKERKKLQDRDLKEALNKSKLDKHEIDDIMNDYNDYVDIEDTF
jgi:uncharacterized membrane protein